MPTDPTGQPHTGNHGLFDDASETARTTALAERHEISRLEGQIRHQKRRDKRLKRKQEKETNTTHQLPHFKRSESKLHVLLGKFFGDREHIRDDGSLGEEKEGEGGSTERKREGTVEYTIVRRPVAPDTIYRAEDVDPVESLWLRECGMVKVKSGDPGGCHIVPKSVIEKSE